MGRAIKLFNIDMDNGRPRRFSTEGRGRIATFRNCVSSVSENVVPRMSWIDNRLDGHSSSIVQYSQ